MASDAGSGVGSIAGTTLLGKWQGDGVKAVEHAAAVLYTLSDADGGMGVRELARELDMNKSTVQRLVTSLHRMHLLSFGGRTQKYFLGAGVVRLAAAVPKRNDLLSAARPHMESLWRESGETICIHVRVNDRRMSLFQLESPRELRFVSDVGRLLPLHTSSAGRCFLSMMSDTELDHVLSSTPAPDDTPMADPDRLRADAMKVREQGYMAMRSERGTGSVSIAAPIPSSTTPTAVICIYGPEQRLTDERARELAPVLLEATRRTAELLG